MSLLLGVNIDHVATLRQARYAGMLDSFNAEPSVLKAAELAKAGGADSLTVHVREDRRHMQEEDVFLLKKENILPLNLEMANTPAMLSLALALKPAFVCLVPESREEVTTEGGLDIVAHLNAVRGTVSVLQDEGIKVSLFIDPEIAQIEAALEVAAEMVELHTGCFANAENEAAQKKEIVRLVSATERGVDGGLQVNAGHGINYKNIKSLYAVRNLSEFNIGHSIVSRALIVGFEKAVREMKDLMEVYPKLSA